MRATDQDTTTQATDQDTTELVTEQDTTMQAAERILGTRARNVIGDVRASEGTLRRLSQRCCERVVKRGYFKTDRRPALREGGGRGGTARGWCLQENVGAEQLVTGFGALLVCTG